MRALVYVLLVSIIVGLVGWINQAYVKERMNWYMTMRPYRVANVDPYVLKPEAERALKPGDSYDVTFADWDACVAVGGCSRVGDSGFGRGTRPVINVNFGDARRYVEWLSKMTGRTYRLLTEAEWEYAARAGSTTAYFWGDQIGSGNANCNECGSQWDHQRTAPVGKFTPNQFGLYDIVGNVSQWVQDCWNADYDGAPTDGSAWTIGDCDNGVVRGGSWFNDPQNLRSADRFRNPRTLRNLSFGIRLGRTLTP